MHEGHCMYGQRCNFIHPAIKPVSGVIEAGLREVKAGGRLRSRLLDLLGVEEV